jgi:hypothetical protein
MRAGAMGWRLAEEPESRWPWALEQQSQTGPVTESRLVVGESQSRPAAMSLSRWPWALERQSQAGPVTASRLVVGVSPSRPAAMSRSLSRWELATMRAGAMG